MKIQKLTDEILITKCRELGVDFVGRYSNKKGNTCVKYICPNHRDKGVQELSWSSFKKKKYSCRYCSGRGLTTEEFITLVTSMNPDIEIIGEYKNDKSRFDCRCKTGDHSWSATAHDLKRHPSCKRCSLKAAWSTKRDAQIESVKKRIYEAQPNIVMIGQYVGYHNNVKCRCSDCGTEWDACPFNLVSGNTGCPKCRELVKIMKLRHDPAEMERTILKLRPDVVLLSQYTRMHDKMHCYCPVHQVEYYQTADKLLIGQRGCVQCANISTGESKMLDILKSLELRYNIQHVLKGCRYREPLRFDAFLPDYNIAIEYDGEGHYMPIDFAGKGDEWAQQALEVTQIRDAIKTEYCAEHNIELIRIPYWKLDNIQEFLTSELQQRINSAT